MDTAKVDKIIQYALAVAASEDDFRSRELGPIHLLKYVYLADLAWAERHQGETYTGVHWQFYNFGPWSPDAHSRIEPACLSIGAIKRTFPYGDEGKEGIRWKSSTSYLDALDRELSATVTLAVKKAVHKFGADTSDLLHYVYLTMPMLNAAPQEFLDFSSAILPLRHVTELSQAPMSHKAQKRREQLLKDTRSVIQQKLAQKKATKSHKSFIRQPRHDEIYEQGTEWLDSLAGPQIISMQGELSFSPDIWKSKARFDPEIH